ncbi:Zinc finger RING-type [Trinorchestia longiramus]|nr:Zinc finger RING-type [Trinorchestia longiramus]
MAEAQPPVPSSVLQALPQLKEMDDLLRCDICYEFLKTSVITACSHNFCSVCIRHCLTYRQTCPSCSSLISESDLRPNRSLDSIIEHFATIRKVVLKVFEERDTHRNNCEEFDLLLKISQESLRGTQSNSSSSNNSRSPVTQPTSPSHYIKDSVKPDHRSGASNNSNTPSIKSNPLSKRKLSEQFPGETDDIVCLGTPNKAAYQPVGSCTPSKTPQKSSSRSLLLALDSIKDGIIPSSAKKLNVLDYFSPKKSSSSSTSNTHAAGGSASATAGSASATGAISTTGSSTSTSGTSNTGSRTVQCPVCGGSVAELHINNHLDTCAQRDVPPPKPTITRPPQRKCIFPYHCKSSPSVIEKGQLKIQKKYKNEFSALLADLKRRRNQERTKKPQTVGSSCNLNADSQRDARPSTSGETADDSATKAVENNSRQSAIPAPRSKASDGGSDDVCCVISRFTNARLEANGEASRSKSNDEVACTPRRSKLSMKRKISLDSTDEFNIEHLKEDTSDCTSSVLRSKNRQLVVVPVESVEKASRPTDSSLNSSLVQQQEAAELFSDYDDDNFSFDEIISQENEFMAEMSSYSVDNTRQSAHLKDAQTNSLYEDLPNGTTHIGDRPASPLEAIRKCQKLPLGVRSNSSNRTCIEAADDGDLPYFEAQESTSKQLQVLVNGTQEINPNINRISSLNDNFQQNGLTVPDHRHQTSGKTSESRDDINRTPRIEKTYENSDCVSPDLFGGGDGDDLKDDSDASSNCSFSLLDDRPQQLKDAGISECPRASYASSNEVAFDYESDEIPVSQKRLHEDKNEMPVLSRERSPVVQIQQLCEGDKDLDETLILESKSCNSTQVSNSSEELCVHRKPGHIGVLCLVSADLESQDTQSSCVNSVASAELQSSCSNGLNLDLAENYETERSTRQTRSTSQQQKEKRSSPARRSCRRLPARSAAVSHKSSLCRTEGRILLDDSSKTRGAASLGNSGRKRKSFEMTHASSVSSTEQEETGKRRSTRRRK